MTDKTNQVKSLETTLRLRNEVIKGLQDELLKKDQECNFLRQVILGILEIKKEK